MVTEGELSSMERHRKHLKSDIFLTHKENKSEELHY